MESRWSSAVGAISVGVKTLEQEQERLLNEQKIILENAGVGISFVKNRKRKWVNAAFCEMFGYSAAEMADVTTRLVYPSQEAYEKLGNEAYPYLATGKTIVTDQLVRRNDGTLFTARLTGTAIDPENLIPAISGCLPT
jgi:PAS domain S-box-containing protein